MTSISELSLEELFPETLTDTSCISIDKERWVWVATEMCAQYVESTIDAIIVRDENNTPIGIVGGYDVLDHLRKNPTRDFQYQTTVEEIMFKDFPKVERNTKLKDLIENWQSTRRAFAVIPNGNGDYSPISARKMLEVGMKCKTDLLASSMPKKKIITFRADDSLGKVIDLMFEHKTRKILLENSNQFVSDRLILGHISQVLKFQKDIEQFLDIPINRICFDRLKEVPEDLKFNDLCATMNKMEHPFIKYNDILISPWDVCLTLISEDLKELVTYHRKGICPHCGKAI
jgi:predicted transcriptional regulator